MRMLTTKAKLLIGAVLGLTLVLSIAMISAAQQNTPPKSAGSAAMPWTPEDMINAETASGFRISPDNKWAVWTKGIATKEKDGRTSNLYLTSLTEKKEVQLTRGTDANGNPRWSPKGDMIAFISTKPVPDAKPTMSKSQLWLMNPFGGEPWVLTTFERGIQRFEWITDDTIIFSAQEDATLYEKDTETRKDDSNVVDDEAHAAPVRLFKYSVKDKKVTRLTNNMDRIQAWAVSRDLTHAVTAHSRELSYAWDQKTKPRNFSLGSAHGSEQTNLHRRQRFFPGSLEWTRDGSGFYAVAPFSDDPRFHDRLHRAGLFLRPRVGHNAKS